MARPRYRPDVGELLALVGFSVVSSVTPGPNNVLLWASGAAFGFRATIPHVAGTALGIGSMALVVAAGLGAVFTAFPEVSAILKLVASVYLLYLAFQIAGAHALHQGAVTHPLNVVQAAGFQLVNPKAWVFALGAVAAFRPAEYPVLVGGALVALTMAVVVVPMASVWAGAGGTLGRLMSRDRDRRLMSAALALLLAATVAYLWI